MDIEKLKEEWQKDCVIDDTKLGVASTDTPLLHAKYISILVDTKLRFTKINNDYNSLKRKKQKYYKGEMSREELTELMWEPYQYNKPLKGEMEELVAADVDIIKYKTRMEYLSAMIMFLESIMDSIKSRNFQIKNILTWNQYLSGG